MTSSWLARTRLKRSLSRVVLFVRLVKNLFSNDGLSSDFSFFVDFFDGAISFLFCSARNETPNQNCSLQLWLKTIVPEILIVEIQNKKLVTLHHKQSDHYTYRNTCWKEHWCTDNI